MWLWKILRFSMTVMIWLFNKSLSYLLIISYLEDLILSLKDNLPSYHYLVLLTFL